MFYLTQCLIFPSGLNQLVKLAVVEAVERKQRDQKVMSSNPAECWTFYHLLSFHSVFHQSCVLHCAHRGVFIYVYDDKAIKMKT